MQELVTIKFHGDTYKRHVEMLGDVEKITWFIYLEAIDEEKEIWSQDMATRLEEEYEKICLAELIPQTFYI